MPSGTGHRSSLPVGCRAGPPGSTARRDCVRLSSGSCPARRARRVEQTHGQGLAWIMKQSGGCPAAIEARILAIGTPPEVPSPRARFIVVSTKIPGFVSSNSLITSSTIGSRAGPFQRCWKSSVTGPLQQRPVRPVRPVPLALRSLLSLQLAPLAPRDRPAAGRHTEPSARRTRRQLDHLVRQQRLPDSVYARYLSSQCLLLPFMDVQIRPLNQQLTMPIVPP